MTAAMKGTRPQGRCPECGKDRALTPSGTMWGHGRWEAGHYQDCGRDAKPMTAKECARWDKFDQAAQQILDAQRQWREQQRQEQAERAEQQELANTRWAFRLFDENSFAACPWRSHRVTFIAIAADAPVTFACDAGRKRALLRSEHHILVAWPGEWSQDIFLLSDQDKVAVLAVL